MKKEKITITKFIKEIPDKQEFITSSRIPSNFKDLSYEDKFKLYNSNAQNTAYRIIKTDLGLFLYFDRIILKRVGKSIFPKKEGGRKATYIDNKLKTNLTYSDVIQFLDILGLDFTDKIDYALTRFIVKPCILKDIFTRRIYSEETLVKAIQKKVYHLKDIPWKSFRTYLTNINDYPSFSLYDLKDFTKDLNESIRIINEERRGVFSSSKLQLLRDMLTSAVKLNEVIDFTWSDKRLSEEHKRQNNLLTEKELLLKDNSQIYQNIVEEPNIKLLNTELDIFLEGTNMHHCLYNCYYNKIKNKQYIAFHMSSPEDCTFSVRLSNHEIVLDQIYLAYDKQVQNNTEEKALAFIEKYKIQLQKMLEVSSIDKS